MSQDRPIVESTKGKMKATAKQLRGVQLTHSEAELLRGELQKLNIAINMSDRLEDE